MPDSRPGLVQCALRAYLNGAYMNIDSQRRFFWDYHQGDRGAIHLSPITAQIAQEKYPPKNLALAINHNTRRVLRCLADPAIKADTWLLERTLRIYRSLQVAGYLVSCEAYTTGSEPLLAGAVLGINLFPLFVADTMFGLPSTRGASAVALAHLLVELHSRGFQFVDVQNVHPKNHPAARLGEVPIALNEFLKLTAPIKKRLFFD